MIFLRAGVNMATFMNDFPLSPRNGYHSNKSQVHGKKISINGREIALFCYKDTFYAVDEKCPHLGRLMAGPFYRLHTISVHSFNRVLQAGE